MGEDPELVDIALSERLAVECGAVVVDLALAGSAVELWSVVGGSAIAATSGASMKTWSRLEFDIGEGPAMQAQRQGRPVLVGDLQEAQGRSWPGYAAAALEAGMCAVYAWPLQVGAIRLGVLVLYGDAVRHLDTGDRARALSAADRCTRLLVDFAGAGYSLTSDSDPGAALGSAAGSAAALTGSVAAFADVLDLRSAVYQAQGMTTARLRVDLSEALARMRAYAFSAGRSLDDVATDIVERRLVLDIDPTRPDPPDPPDA